MGDEGDGGMGDIHKNIRFCHSSISGVSLQWSTPLASSTENAGGPQHLTNLFKEYRNIEVTMR
jgi:hypothetical protein